MEVKDLNGTQARPPLTSDTTSIKIDGLRPNTEYIFQVSAMTECGSGPPTHIQQRTTERGKVAYFVMGNHLGMINPQC